MQFTLSRLLASTALIAVGCFGISLAMRWKQLSPDAKVAASILVVTPFIWIGAGIGLPFGRWREGAGLGVLVTFLMLMLVAA